MAVISLCRDVDRHNVPDATLMFGSAISALHHVAEVNVGCEVVIL